MSNKQEQKKVEKVRVMCGGYDEEHNLAGQTVGYVRKMMAEVANIEDNPQILVNGTRQENDDYVLQGGEILEFVKAVGEKG